MAQVGTTKFYLTNGKREKFISASGGKVARRVVVGLRPERKEDECEEEEECWVREEERE